MPHNEERLGRTAYESVFFDRNTKESKFQTQTTKNKAAPPQTVELYEGS